MENLSMNSPILWVGALITLSLVLLQVVVIFRKTVTVSKKCGITKPEVRSIVRASSITAVGPSLVGALSFVPLALAIGTPLAFIRVSIIGAPDWELAMSQMCRDVLGIAVGAPLTASQLMTVYLGMSIAMMIYWPITIAGIGGLEKMRKKMSSATSGTASKSTFAGVLSICGILAGLFFTNLGYVIKFDQKTIAWVVGFGLMILVMLLNKKKKSQLVAAFSLPIISIVAMLAAEIAM